MNRLPPCLAHPLPLLTQHEIDTRIRYRNTWIGTVLTWVLGLTAAALILLPIFIETPSFINIFADIASGLCLLAGLITALTMARVSKHQGDLFTQGLDEQRFDPEDLKKALDLSWNAENMREAIEIAIRTKAAPNVFEALKNGVAEWNEHAQALHQKQHAILHDLATRRNEADPWRHCGCACHIRREPIRPEEHLETT